MFISSDEPKRILIPESLAIELANSSEISAETFYRRIFRRYQQLHKQKNRQKKVGRKKYTITTSSPPALSTVQIGQTEKILSAIKPTIPLIEIKVKKVKENESVSEKEETVAYLDDEDLNNDYDDRESSGATRLLLKMKPNETSTAYEYDDFSNE